MKFTREDYLYLKGKRFSNGYYMKLENNPLYARQDILLNYAKGKNIIHVGCCDHIPLIKDKIAQKRWIHGLFEDVSQYVLGVDINQEAVDYVNNNVCLKEKVYCADITSDDLSKYIAGRKIDYIIMGEILEHVDDPVNFLSSVKKNMTKSGFSGEYIITVPNALSFLCSKKMEKGYECINTDHRYWFTPYTISKVMFQAGIMPNELLFCGYGKGGNGKNLFENKCISVINHMRKIPLSYKSFRGSTIVAIGC